jgi:hypothetical protein
MDTILNFKIGLAGNSKLNIQHSKFKIGIADNSKLKTQNSKSALPIIQNSKLKIQLLIPQFSLSAFCLPR